MFSIPATFLLYNFLAIVCPGLCAVSERLKVKWGIYLAYGLLVLFSVMRFDIGADYANYASLFTEKAQILDHGTLTILDYFKPEPLIYLFIFLFKGLDYCYVYVFACISLVTLFFLYKALEYYKIHALGLLVYVVSFVFFQTWDWARQGIALSIFLFSLRYVERREPWKYEACMLLAMLSHYSALLLVPTYLVYRYTPRHKLTVPLLCGFLFLMFALGVVGFFSSMHDRIASLIPFYGQLYSGTAYTQNGAGTYRTTTYMLTVILYICIIFFSRKEHAGLSMILGLGAFVYIIAGGNLNFTRMAWYLTSIQVILIPKILLDSTGEMYNKLFVRYLYLFFLMFVIFEYVYLKANFRDVVPYETLFSEEFDRQYFKPRVY